MLSLPHIEETSRCQNLLSIFMRLDSESGELTAFHPAQFIPTSLNAPSTQNWLTQLSHDERASVQNILANNRCAVMQLFRPEESWLLEFVPDTFPLWLICAHRLIPDMSAIEKSGLQMLTADLIAFHTTDVQRNQLLLQHLKQQSGCDRLLLWHYRDSSIIPLHVLGACTLPSPQPIDIRYAKLICKRSSIGFSDPTQVPMLQSQGYLLEDGIRARLDVPIFLPATPIASTPPLPPAYLLTLEYTAIQSNFSELEYRQAEHIASLLLHKPLLLEQQPLSDLDAEVVQTAGLRGNAYWQALAALLLRREHGNMILLRHHKGQLFPSAFTDKRQLKHHPDLLTGLTRSSDVHNLSEQQLEWLQEMVDTHQQLEARCYPLRDEQQAPAGAILLWREKQENRWQGADTIIQLTIWHSMVELGVNNSKLRHTSPTTIRARLKGRGVQHYRKPLKR